MMKRILNFLKKNDYLIIIFLTILSSIVLFSSEIVPNDDFIYHITRINLIEKEISLGNFFSKMYHGYLYGFGYGSGLFYPDLFLYIPALFHYIGIGIINSYKIFVIMINFFSIFSMYYVVKKIFKNKDMAIVGSIIYAFSSYRLTDVFIRCALGEALSFIFIPIVIYGIYLILYDDYKEIYILIIGMSELVYSHLLSVYIISIIILIMVIINIKKLLKEKERLLYLFLATLITILISSFYLFPMLEQMIDRKFYIFDGDGFLGTMSDRAVPFYKSILEIPHSNKFWIPNGIGMIFLVIIVLYFVERKELKKEKNNFYHLLFILGIIFLILSTNLFPWKYFNKIFSVIQFPWRFYAVVTIFLTIIGSKLFIIISDKRDFIKNIVFVVSIISLASIFINYFNIDKVDDKFIEDYNVAIGVGDYLPKEIDYDLFKQIISKKEKYEKNIIRKDDYLIVNYQKSNEHYYEVPYIYYLGYRAYANNKELEVIKTNNGLVGINVSGLDSTLIKVYYKNTNITNISKYISILGLLILVIYIVGDKNDFIRGKKFKTNNIG